MRRMAHIVAVLLTITACDCKPDAAVRRGAMVDAAPRPAEKDVRKPGEPIIVPPEK